MPQIVIMVEPGLSGTYEKYDIVEILPDNTIGEGIPGNETICLPKFLVCNVAGKLDDLIKFREVVVAEQGIDEIIVVMKRKYKFNFDSHLGESVLSSIKKSNWLEPSISIINIEDKLK